LLVWHTVTSGARCAGLAMSALALLQKSLVNVGVFAIPNVEHTMKSTPFLLLVFGCRLSVFGCRQNFEGVPFSFEIDLPAHRPQHWSRASRYLHGATMLTRMGNAEMEMKLVAILLQSQDREGARPQLSAGGARHRRRGDRMSCSRVLLGVKTGGYRNAIMLSALPRSPDIK
jgi:hypothetical protein